jgi:phospholipid transport system substrate-binding protein
MGPYSSQIDHYSGERIRCLSESIDGDYAVVRGSIHRKRGTDVAVEARMLRRGEGWRVYDDDDVDNMSLVANYRAQFDRIIRAASYEELVRRLKRTQEEVPGAGVCDSRPNSQSPRG